jgi:gluconolactonase
MDAMRRRDFIQVGAGAWTSQKLAGGAARKKIPTALMDLRSTIKAGCSEQGRVTRTEKDGSITVLATAFEGTRRNNPNDLVYAIDGSIYFSVIQARGNATPGNAALYQLTRKGELRVASREWTRPNGVALAANQEKLFIADTDQRNVRVFEVQGDGAHRNGRIFCEVKGDDAGGPDGLKTDESGNVWVT